MHCVTIKKPSFHALCIRIWCNTCSIGTFPKYCSTQAIKDKLINIHCYNVTKKNRHHNIFFTVRLIALNKNIEL